MRLARFHLRTLMIVVVVAAIASALIAAIRTLDDREKTGSYWWVAGWVVCVLCLYAVVLRRGRRRWDSSPPDLD